MKRDRRDCLAGLGTTSALLAAAPWLQATFEIYPGTHTGDIAVRSQEHVAASRRSRTSTRHALPLCDGASPGSGERPRERISLFVCWRARRGGCDVDDRLVLGRFPRDGWDWAVG